MNERSSGGVCELNVTISIIVPVYNSEDYLEICVDKILRQSFQDFELILVDDGSLDHSLQICNDLAEKDSRIRVVHQENRGVSRARNTGIEQASGDYIAFIDSDDMVSPAYFECLLEGIKEECVILSMCGHIRIHQYEDIYPVSHERSRYLPAKQCAKKLLLGQFPISICGALFKSALMKDLRFPSGIRNNEDKLFLFHYLLNHEDGVVAFSNEKLYGYMVREGSAACGSWRSIRDIVTVADRIREETHTTHPEWESLAECACVAARLDVMKSILRSDKINEGEEAYDSLKREVIKFGFPHNGNSRLKVEYLAVRLGKPVHRLLVNTYYKIYTSEKQYQHNEKMTRQR